MKAQGKSFKEIGDTIGKTPAACANRHKELSANQNQNQRVQNQPNQTQNWQNQSQSQLVQKSKASVTTIELQPDKDFSQTDASSKRLWFHNHC